MERIGEVNGRVKGFGVLVSLVMLFFALVLSASPAGAAGPGQNQAFLYELSEDATLYGLPLACTATGCVPTSNTPAVLVPGPGPTGVVVADTITPTNPGTPGFPVNRSAVSALQGNASYPSPLCPAQALVTNPRSDTCTVTMTGNDSVTLVNGTTPTGGATWGTFDIVIQLDNLVDSPEWPVGSGAFYGTITFGAPGVPIGSANGFFVLGGSVLDAQACAKASATCLAFNAKFRQPFAVSAKGEQSKPRRGKDAFYLLDTGKLQPVQANERAAGWPTVRFEVSF